MRDKSVQVKQKMKEKKKDKADRQTHCSGHRIAVIAAAVVVVVVADLYVSPIWSRSLVEEQKKQETLSSQFLRKRSTL